MKAVIMWLGDQEEKTWSSGFLYKEVESISSLLQTSMLRVNKYSYFEKISTKNLHESPEKKMQADHSPGLDQQPSYLSPIVHTGECCCCCCWRTMWLIRSSLVSERPIFRFSEWKNVAPNAVGAPSRLPRKTLAPSHCGIFLNSLHAFVRLVFLLLAGCLPLGDGFHKVSGAGVAAQCQQNRHCSKEHIQGDNRQTLFCWDSVGVGSAGMQRRTDVAPLGLRRPEGGSWLYVVCFFEGLSTASVTITAVTWAMAPAKKMVTSNIQLHPGVNRP